MASSSAEDSVFQAAKSGLRRWLARARKAIMAPFEQFSAQPDANAIYSTVPDWMASVNAIMAALEPAIREGWAAAHLRGELDMSDPFVQANLALTHNLLVRVPDEVHALVIKMILEGVNRGEPNSVIAQRVDAALDFTGSENWESRARTIANTEANRHYNSSLLAHALLVEREDGGIYLKEWQTRTDGHERPAHFVADHQVRTLSQPYIVDDQQLMFPGDPTGLPENVINCRCLQTVRKA